MEGFKVVSLEESLKSVERTEGGGSLQQLSAVNLEQGAWVNFQLGSGQERQSCPVPWPHRGPV